MKMIGLQETSEVISTKSYTGTLLIGSIPVIGEICLLKWMKDKNVRESKQNLCKAYLIVKVSLIIPIVIMAGLVGYCCGIRH